MRLVSIGEIIWDLIPGREVLGGAPLNVAVNARRLGHEVRLVSGVGPDERGRMAVAALGEAGVDTRHVRETALPTGTAAVTLGPDGSPSFDIARPAAYDAVELDEADLADLVAWAPDVVAFGTLAQSAGGMAAATRRIAAALPGALRLYDVNARPGVVRPGDVSRLLPLASVVKVSIDELPVVAAAAGVPARPAATFAAALQAGYRLRAVAVTRGAAGCGLRLDGTWVSAPAYDVRVVDAVGAGDAFTAGLAHGLVEGWPAAEVADFALRVAAAVVARPGGAPHWAPADLLPPRDRSPDPGRGH